MVKKKKTIKPSPRPKQIQPAEGQSPAQQRDKTLRVDRALSEGGKAADLSTGAPKAPSALSRPALAVAGSIAREPQRPSKPSNGEAKRESPRPETAVVTEEPNATKQQPAPSKTTTSKIAGVKTAASNLQPPADSLPNATTGSALAFAPSLDETAKPPGKPAVPRVGGEPKPGSLYGRREKEQEPIHETQALMEVASQPFHDFATETQRIARESFEETTNLLGKLRGAKNPIELVALQTTYMQHSLRMYAAFAQGFGKLMALSQSTLIKQGQATIESLGSITAKE